MQVLDRTGVGTLWSICKTKFALAGHTHNYAGSGSAGGSANSAISVVDYGQTSKTIQIGYAGSGITGEQIKYIAGYTSGSGDVNAKIKDVSKEALRSWLGLGTLAYSSATITDNKVTQNAVKSSDYTNWRSLVFSASNSATEGFTPSTTTDGVFIANTLSVQPSSGTIKAIKFKGALEGNASTASNASTVNGHTVNANVPSNAKFTDTNTWRPIQDNLISTSTSESLSANQGRVLKGLVDGKANSSHTHNSLAAVGNEQISATAYSSGLHFKPYYSSGGPTTYGNILEYTSTNTGGGQLAMEWTGSQTESDGTDNNVGRVYYRSKRDCINGWTKWMALAYTNDIPTKLSQLTNDKGFVTGSVSGNTVTINGASTTWTNTWRGIQDNLTSSSTSDSLSANQGRILKDLIDSKANSNEVIKSVSVELYGDTHSGFTPTIVVKDNANQKQAFTIDKANGRINGLMSIKDKNKLNGIDDRANNYTLPIATETTLGGIKVNFVPKDGNCRFKVQRDINGNANTFIPGLKYGDDECLGGVQVAGDSYTSVIYTGNGVTFNDQQGQKIGNVKFRGTNGTFALLSDIPDVSNLCRFNFVNSISECRGDRINFLLRFTGYDINLSDFDDYPDGTILIITTTENSTQIRHQSGIWYSGGDRMNTSEYHYTYKDRISLITKNNGTVHHYEF